VELSGRSVVRPPPLDHFALWATYVQTKLGDEKYHQGATREAGGEGGSVAVVRLRALSRPVKKIRVESAEVG